MEIDKDLPAEDFTELHKVLSILKYLIAKFETPKTSMSSAFVLLENAINALYELSLDYNNQYAKCIAESLQQYTLLSENGGLWALAYIFTPEGRSDFQKRAIKHENPHIKGSLKHFKFIEENNDENIEDTNGEVIIPENEEVMMTVDGKECY